MIRYTIDFIVIIIVFSAIYSQRTEIEELKLEISGLEQAQSYDSNQLNLCEGKVIAFNKAFDYHVVMSELGLYPQIKKEIYLTKKEEK